MSKTKSVRKHHSLKERRKQQTPMWKKWAPLIAVAVGAVLLLAAIALPRGGGAGISDDGTTDFSATTLAGEDIQLSDYRGQVVMLNFWATWCPPCRAEMPTIQSVYEARQSEGFTVLAVNNAEGPELIQPFVNSLGLNFPIVLDTSTRLQRTFDIRSYPTSIFIDAQGEVYATHTGLVTQADLSRYVDEGLARSVG